VVDVIWQIKWQGRLGAPPIPLGLVFEDRGDPAGSSSRSLTGLFSVPVVIVVTVAFKALKIMMLMAKPRSKLIPVDSTREVAEAKR
jgi:hypothetical protein